MSPERLTTATVITMTAPPAPSRSKPKLTTEEQNRRAEQRIAVSKLYHAGKITEGEYTLRMIAIDADPPEDAARLPIQQAPTARPSEPAPPPNRRSARQAFDNMFNETLAHISDSRNRAEDAGNTRVVNRWRQHASAVLALRDKLIMGQLDPQGALTALSELNRRLDREPAVAKPMASPVTVTSPPTAPGPAELPERKRRATQTVRWATDQLNDAATTHRD